MTVKLKPCPFCCCEDIEIIDCDYPMLNEKAALCQSCGGLGSGKPTSEEAADAWNRGAEFAGTQGWQPIETAPKDFTEILVGWWHVPDPEEPEEHLDEYGYQRIDPAIDLTKPRWISCKSSYEDYGWRRGFRHRNGANRATHWMPLPAPPAEFIAFLEPGNYSITETMTASEVMAKFPTMVPPPRPPFLPPPAQEGGKE